MKVYIVNYTLVLDGAYQSNETHAFSTMESAKELFDKLVAEDKESNAKKGWSDDSSELSNNYFTSWSDDGYAMNHCLISIRECEVL